MTSALRNQRQQDDKLEANLGYIAKICPPYDKLKWGLVIWRGDI